MTATTPSHPATTEGIIMQQTGGPEVMQWSSWNLPSLGDHDVHIRHDAIGLNFIDVYFRTGLYPQPLPGYLGMEGAGTVVAVGRGVQHLQVGDKVAYAGKPNGAYARERVMPADIVVKRPDGLDAETAAAIMLQGLTAQYLLRRTYRVQAGDTIVVHAAAGGVGVLLVQWAKHLGATVIGTVSTAAKAELAKGFGCDHVVIQGQDDLVATVKACTNGEGVPVVYDSVGKDTFMASLDCLRPLGLMVSYGNASGPVPAMDLGLLSAKGSLFITRPTLMTYTQKRSDLEVMAAELFDVVQRGVVKVHIGQRYPLKDVQQAHRDLEARKTVGATVLLP